jgi:superfamily II DNA or RNA helicase
MRKQEKTDTDGGAFPDHVRFAHSWREYQRDVLAQMDVHLEDGRLHVVAPPGSGKTILGLRPCAGLAIPH